MKTLDSGLAAHIAQTVTTLAWCWKLTRNDDVVQGFTDHDRDLSFDGVTYAAATGFTASQMQGSLGLQVDNLEASGALSSGDLNEDDLGAGLYDSAEIEIWRVNWADTSQRVLMRKGTLGEVKRGKAAFQAEIRGLAQALNQPQGRAFGYACDADLGDSRCSPNGEVDLTDPAFLGNGTVAALTDNRRFTATGLSFVDTWCGGGKLTWLTGANAGLAMEVKRYSVVAGVTTIELWQPMSRDVAVADTFKITAGCDKQFPTCKAKFANVKNYRGFPYMPGNDSITSYPNSNQDMDGGSYYGN
ncbi:MAG TPA: DUF2163 domain-containing protein [Rhizomicrobium sp.]|jgi:uncharacterized phage protein (TIGR02218 family)